MNLIVKSARGMKVIPLLSGLAIAGALIAGCSTAEDDYSSSNAAGTSGTSASGSGKDALDYPQVNYQFTCSGVPGSKTVPVSDGPCISSQKAFAKSVSCNEFDADYTFKSTGKPFYQCLVNNTTDSSAKKTYQQNLDFYSK